MKHKNTVERIAQKASVMRRHVIEMGYRAGGRGAHFGPALSSIEILASLYFEIMHHDPKNPRMPARDRFVLSKGHGCLSYYAALVESGYITKEQMYRFKANNSFLFGHPSRNIAYGLEISSGSLGNGFAIACGIAKAAKIKHEEYKVYCVVGDGECNEGIVWEAVMNAVKNKLDNLIVIIDRNGVQLAGNTTDIMDLDIEAIWKAFGWDVSVVEKGNDISSILRSLKEMKHSDRKRPHVIIAQTTKGKGVSFMEGDLGWHARPMGKEDYERAISDLEKEERRNLNAPQSN